MSLSQHKQQVLTILYDNLKESPPQLVPSSRIAGQMNLSQPALGQVLTYMQSIGIIETDMDQRHNLITRKGLLMYRDQNYTG